MSRTDKDMPRWVRVEQWREWHNRCENATQHRWPLYLTQQHACDLPAWRRSNPGPVIRSVKWWIEGHCIWEPAWDRSYLRSHAPKWFVDHVWHNPERRRERDHLRRLAQEWNANGELEDADFPCWQARNYAKRMW